MRNESYPITAFGISEPHAAQLRVLHAAPEKSILYLGGRGSGKTIIGCVRSILQCMRPENAGCAYAIVAPTYRLLVRVHLKILLAQFAAFKEHTGWDLVKRHYKHDQRIVLRNNAEIYMCSFSNIDRIRSMTLSAGVFLDEIEVDSDPMETLATIAGSIRGSEGSQGLLVTTTPRGLRGTVRHWIEKTQVGSDKFDDNYRLFISKTSDNPYINQAFIDRMRASMSKAVFDQEVNARITRVSSSVLGGEWSREKHLIPYTYSKGTKYAIAVDPGYSHASVLFIATVPRSSGPDREIVFQEFHPEDQSFDKTINDIKRAVRLIGMEPYMISSDRALPQFNQKLIRCFTGTTLKTMQTKAEQQVWAGMDRIRALLDPEDGPPVLYVSNKLLKTPRRGIIVSIENLRRGMKNGTPADTVAKTADGYDHVIDALAYFVKGKYGRKGYSGVYDSGGSADYAQLAKGRFGKL